MRQFRVFGVVSEDRPQHVWPETNQSPVEAESPALAAEKHFKDRLAWIEENGHGLFRDRLAVLDPEEQELRFFEYTPAQMRQVQT